MEQENTFKTEVQRVEKRKRVYSCQLWLTTFVVKFNKTFSMQYVVSSYISSLLLKYILMKSECDRKQEIRRQSTQFHISSWLSPGAKGAPTFLWFHLTALTCLVTLTYLWDLSGFYFPQENYYPTIWIEQGSFEVPFVCLYCSSNKTIIVFSSTARDLGICFIFFTSGSISCILC